jgi:pentapeptide repeat protein
VWLLTFAAVGMLAVGLGACGSDDGGDGTSAKKPSRGFEQGKVVNGCKIEPGTRCPGADLQRANLRGADLTRANLTGAKLQRADLTDADLTGATLFEANLQGATGGNAREGKMCKTYLPDHELNNRDCPALPKPGTAGQGTGSP